MKALVIVLSVLALLGGGGIWYWVHNSQPSITFKTAEVKRGQLLATISATGSIEPEAVVDVGAQVAGLIVSFGDDADGKPVDYDSPVKAGMVLAKIDDAVYKADRDIAAAQLDQAKATVQKSEADLQQAQALQYQAQQNWLRAQKIGPSDALSKNDYDMFQATSKTTMASVAVAEAEELVQSKTAVAQAKATLDKAQRNLDFCTIVSPVDGVIITRRVNIGQTVVSSLNAPSLFLIAKDLRKMQIWVAVNEADIEQIGAGQNVTFSCDGLPGRTFEGSVNKVRLNAQTTQNVVTYTVEVNFNNADGKLKPYKTANVQFELNKDPDVLLVPNAALRWYPSDKNEVAPAARAQWKPIDADEDEKPAPAQEAPGPKSPGKKKPLARYGMIWISDGQHVSPEKVQIGPTDGINTEVSGADLKTGQPIVVGEIEQSSADGQERNPFLPQMHGHK